MRLYTSGLTYPEACQLSDELKTAGIDSNIVTGALAINPPGWDYMDFEQRAKWLTTVDDVIGDRCSWSSELPLVQQLVLGKPAAKARLKNIGVDI